MNVFSFVVSIEAPSRPYASRPATGFVVPLVTSLVSEWQPKQSFSLIGSVTGPPKLESRRRSALLCAPNR